MNRPPIQLQTYKVDAEKREAGLRIEMSESGLLKHDIVLGANTMKPSRFGIWGREASTDRLVALDTSLPKCYFIVGARGSGKSLNCQVLLEIATHPNHRLWNGSRTMAAVAFHYATDEGYHAEYPALMLPNNDQFLLDILEAKYRAGPDSHTDVIVVVPEILVNIRYEYYKRFGVKVIPFKFSMEELDADDLKLLIGAYGQNAAVLDRMNQLIWLECAKQKVASPKISLEQLRKWMLDSPLPQSDRDMIEMRLSVAGFFMHDGPSLRSYMKPGRLLMFDMRCKAITDEVRFALGVVALNTTSQAMDENGELLTKFALFDEAHNVMTPEARGIMRILSSKQRTNRHQGLTIAIASQDPLGADPLLIEMSDVVQIFRAQAPSWLGKLGEHCIPFAGMDPYEIQSLENGECFVWTEKASERDYKVKPMRMRVRPSATLPGGSTITDAGPVVGH